MLLLLLLLNTKKLRNKVINKTAANKAGQKTNLR